MSEEKIAIDNDVPVPDYAPRPTTRVYPWEDMEVGDSFAVPEGVKEQTLRSTAYAWAKRNAPGRKFRVRRDESGRYRCWRVE